MLLQCDENQCIIASNAASISMQVYATPKAATCLYALAHCKAPFIRTEVLAVLYKHPPTQPAPLNMLMVYTLDRGVFASTRSIFMLLVVIYFAVGDLVAAQTCATVS